VFWVKGSVVWVLDMGEAGLERGTLRRELLMLSGIPRLEVLASSLSSVAVCWGDLSELLGAGCLLTVSLICDGTRTQAKVRSWVTQFSRMSQARISMYAGLWSLLGIRLA
jgi:hypothetical protein